jgi:multimeric flavodoxin WrbA
MKLLIINGSPRGKNSNSTLLSEKFVDGFMSINNHSVDIANIAIKSTRDNIHSQIKECDSIILIFPLYTDCMPGIVMEFFENIFKNKLFKNKQIGYIIHSGFPESVHSIYLERYLDKLSSRLECKYLGTVIKGGSEGLKIMSSMMTKKIFTRFYNLGKIYAETGLFDDEIKKQLREPFRLSKTKLKFLKVLSKTGITNFYWNMNLKKNNAMHLRDAQPYC